IEKVFEEQKFQMSGCVEECLIEIGMLLGAKEIVIGSAGRFGSTYTISARLVNATSGEMIRSSDFDSEGGIEQLLTEGMKEVALRLITGLNQEPKKIMGLSSTMLQDSIETEILANSEIMKHGQNYLVSIDNIFLDESDFGKYTSFFNLTYDAVEIIVVKNFNHEQSNLLPLAWDNKLIDTSVYKRGLIDVNKHQVLKFNKDYVYEIAIIEPQSSPKNIYWIKSEKGDWVFRKGKVRFGKNSYIELSQVLK
ncbi:MAG: hypothetical protein HN815_06750, partial [Candidatus Marinimicrobia bacterium]|nr:hypothetical protein [Candidatus Neomarinimicrobiota bacterium]